MGGQQAQVNEGPALGQALLNERLKAAADLLTSSNHQAGGIAALLHFSSSAHFCRAFKEKYGLTALQYRREHGRGA